MKSNVSSVRAHTCTLLSISAVHYNLVIFRFVSECCLRSTLFELHVGTLWITGPGPCVGRSNRIKRSAKTSGGHFTKYWGWGRRQSIFPTNQPQCLGWSCKRAGLALIYVLRFRRWPSCRDLSNVCRDVGKRDENLPYERLPDERIPPARMKNFELNYHCT